MMFNPGIVKQACRMGLVCFIIVAAMGCHSCSRDHDPGV